MRQGGARWERSGVEWSEEDDGEGPGRREQGMGRGFFDVVM